MGYFPMAHCLTFVHSFEANCQANVKYVAPQKIRLRSIRTTVTKALAGTDAGTIVLKNNAGSTIATISLPASTAIDAVDTTAVDLVVEAGEGFTLVAAKTTAGGTTISFVDYDILTT